MIEDLILVGRVGLELTLKLALLGLLAYSLVHWLTKKN